jgi:hypothetical protein
VRTLHETWRADGYRAMLELLRTKAHSARGSTPVRANQLLLLYAGPDVYHVLVDVYRWTHEDWANWTVATIAEQVFGRTDLLETRG